MRLLFLGGSKNGTFDEVPENYDVINYPIFQEPTAYNFSHPQPFTPVATHAYETYHKDLVNWAGRQVWVMASGELWLDVDEEQHLFDDYVFGLYKKAEQA